MPFSFRGLLVALVLSAPLESAQAGGPRLDPPGQLFRRAAMAQSARSIVVNLATNLHLAFDADKCRVHTVWQGTGLELWGPPYHGAKTPFLATIGGSNLWEFPALVPWFETRGQPAKVNYLGFHVKGQSVRFIYELRAGKESVRVEETPSLLHRDGKLVFLRAFEVGAASAPWLFLAHAELNGEAALTGRGVRITGQDAVYEIQGGDDNGIGWEAVTEQVDYSYERITEAGTEQGNPLIRRKGSEARAYARIPAHDAPISFTVEVLLEPGRGRSTFSEEPTHASEPVVFESTEEQRPDGGDESYRIEYFPLPPEIELLVTGMDWLPDGRLAVSTWPGEIYLINNPTGSPAKATYHCFARGLNEPLGLAVHAGEIYVVQKGELTRVRDTDEDGSADTFECISDDWGYSGNYHSYSFGPVIDEAGNFHVFTAGQRARWDLPLQGYALRISPDGSEIESLAHGLRAPNGYGQYRGALFFVDNQGNWVGACKLSQVIPGGFHGFPSSRPAPRDERRAAKDVQPPAIWFPRELAPSSSGMATISDERFGPFTGQLLVGDFQNAIVTRVFLEEVNGRWQGAVFPFARGFLSGVNRLSMGPDGKLYVGGVKRTWSAAAPREFSLDRVSYTGELPFEVRGVRATPHGFALEFTQPVLVADAEDPENYAVSQFAYEYHEEYGSPKFDHEGMPGETEIQIESATVTSDGRIVELKLPGLKPGFVTHFQLPFIRSGKKQDIRQEEFWYTLNQIPAE